MIFHLDSCFFVHHFAFLKVFGSVKHVDRAAGLAQGAMDRGGLEVGRCSFHITWTCRFSKRLAVCGIQWVRWSLVTLPTFWSLVTLPTSLGRVASDPLVFFLWPCSLKNTSHRILFLVVACDPTYLFGRVASDHFLALAIPKHLP